MENLNKKKNIKSKKKVLWVISVFVIILIIEIISVHVIREHGGNAISESSPDSGKINLPWENGEKKPVEYTLEEFEKLTDVQQELFFEWFDSKDDFEQWMNDAKKQNETKEIVIPWECGEKKPSVYTMKEFEELTDVQQELFFEWFDSVEEFEKWYNDNK